MAERISLNMERDPHDEPVITTADHIKEKQDKSMMPWPDHADRQQAPDEQRPSRSRRTNRRRTRRSRRKTRTVSKEPEPTPPKPTSPAPDPEEVEKKAVQKVVKQLREKGMSDEFIKENMGQIRERVRKELDQA